MKKKKPKNAGREEANEYKPWMLKNISPKTRKMAKDCAREQNWKVGDWVEYAILKTSQGEGGESSEEGEGTIDAETFSEMMERLPDKEFMRKWFIDLIGEIGKLSEKMDGIYKPPSVERKPWWPF